jgi:peptide chain release factor 2
MLNKAEAIKRLKEKLIAIAQDQALADFNEIKGDLVEATFGQQIRNYVFAPYKMVKDTRTGYETSQVELSFIQLMPFIFLYCYLWKQKSTLSQTY